MDYESMMNEMGTSYSPPAKPRTSGGQNWGMHAGAALSGFGQGMMSPRMKARYDAGGGGYQDLYKQYAYAQGLKEMESRSRINDMKRRYGDILGNTQLESLERGTLPFNEEPVQGPPQKGKGMGASAAQGAGAIMKAFGGAQGGGM